MHEEIKQLALKTVETIHRTVKKALTHEFHAMGKNIGIGADGTPTKYLDKIAEDAALRCIKKSGMKINVLSEEAGFIDHHAPYTFVLDPVDGTRNAVRGIPFYAVSLAVGQKTISDVEYGIVQHIPTGDVFIAEKGKGAYLNKHRIMVPEVPANELLSCLALGKHADTKTTHLGTQNYVRAFGCSSLEMCYVATGGFDYYMVERNYLRVTDIAAATLVVREAGGFVYNLAGDILDMEFSLQERTNILVAGSEKIIHDLLQ
ncbi:MAG: inositol monophosphatase family protein [Candidatus Thermoplasmatota archaeon]